ncbi:MAG TPA: DUF5678 domain-containing protein [Candidatus Deferrimicrobium sp.]|nr:DUF5678 domain-containing protein [Candidatus Deferrimicrobium sp.]
MVKISIFVKILNDLYDLKTFESADANNTWLNENIDEIRKKFENKFVAIYNSQIIDSDDDIENLLKRIEGLKIPIDLIKIEYIRPEKLACIL